MVVGAGDVATSPFSHSRFDVGRRDGAREGACGHCGPSIVIAIAAAIAPVRLKNID